MELEKVVEYKLKGYNKKEISIKNGDITLHSGYYLPNDLSNLQGAVIILHGSAPTTHYEVSFYTKLGTQLDMAVLAFDKRGVGKSGGQFENFSVERSDVWFNLLASDVVACYNWLQQQPELQGKKIGLMGGSQAGWIMPLTANKIPDLGFMIIGEGAAVSAGEEQFFSQLTGDGIEEKMSIEEADEQLQNNFNGDKGFDPTPYLEKLKVPTLWIFGTNDSVIPVAASIRALDKIDNPYFQIEVLKNGNHDFINVETGKRHDLLIRVKPWLKNIGMIE